MKVRDIQFVRYLLANELGIDTKEVLKLFDYDINVHNKGESDQISINENVIEYCSPSSIELFIYKVLYHILKDYADDEGKDKLALGLFYIIKNYVSSDYDQNDIEIPVLISFDKLVPSFIVHEIIEPIIGRIEHHKVLYYKSSFIDTCKIINSKPELDVIFGESNLSELDFPIILTNCDIHNSAAQHADLLAKYLQLGVGKEKSDKIIKNILIESDVFDCIYSMLKLLNEDPDYPTDFIGFLASSVDFSPNEKNILNENSLSVLKNLKTASDGLRTPQVFNQWSQWSMLMGLIEKQLSPMRGSMWPSSELIKPHEDRLRLFIKERSDKKNRRLNFEEMLEASRDWYGHNAIEPGKLIETILKDKRAWKR